MNARKMDQDDESKPDFHVKFSTDDPNSLLMQQLVELRAEVGAITVLVMDALVASGKDPLELAKQYSDSRKELLLSMMFSLQDNASSPPEKSD